MSCALPNEDCSLIISKSSPVLFSLLISDNSFRLKLFRSPVSHRSVICYNYCSIFLADFGLLAVDPGRMPELRSCRTLAATYCNNIVPRQESKMVHWQYTPRLECHTNNRLNEGKDLQKDSTDIQRYDE